MSADVPDPPGIALELVAKGAGVTELEVKSMVDASDADISDDVRRAEAAETAEELGTAALDIIGADPVIQGRLHNGVVLNVVPTRPNLGLGEVGYASWSMYHQVLILPNTEHATWSQYVRAFSVLAIARFSCLEVNVAHARDGFNHSKRSLYITIRL